MKKMLRKFNISFLFFFTFYIHAIGMHKEDKFLGHEKKKTYFKTYNLKSGDKIFLTNQFGEVKIHTWDKQKLSIDVDIIVKGSKESSVMNTLNKIYIYDTRKKNKIIFKTKIGDCSKESFSTSNKVIINYTVYIPKNYSLSASNSFGEIVMEDYKGKLKLSAKHGSIIAGDIDNLENIKCEFGKVNIKSIKGGNIIAKHSTIYINDLRGSVDAIFNFCESVNMKMNSDISGANIQSNYSDLIILLDKKLINSKFFIESSFGKISNNSNINLILTKHKKGRFIKEYATPSNHRSSKKIFITNKFGKIILK